MRIILAGLITVLLPIITSAKDQTSCADPGPHPLYSRLAETIDRGEVRSPDGNKSVKATTIYESDRTHEHVNFRIISGPKRFSANLPGFDTEITWSPDSRAFAVTETEGGGIGYRVYVFFVDGQKLRKLQIAPVLEKAFQNPTKCEISVPPNTGFVKWLDGSDRVLAAAEVVPVSICQCSGMFKLYEVDLRNISIVHTFDQESAKNRFADVLGCELRDAKDCAAAVRQ